MKNQNLHIGLKYGLFLLAIGILFGVVNTFMYHPENISYTLNIIGGLLTCAVLITFFALAHYQSYLVNDRYLSFKNALLTGLLMIGIYWIFTSAFGYLMNELFIKDKIKQYLITQSSIPENQVNAMSSLTGASIWLYLLNLMIYIFVLLFIIMYEANWRIYQKAGEKGWYSIVPVYNIIVLLRMVKKPVWWIFLLMIPFINIIFIIWIYNLLSLRFGKDEGFTVGLILLPFIFLPLLGLSRLRYQDDPPVTETQTAG